MSSDNEENQHDNSGSSKEEEEANTPPSSSTTTDSSTEKEIDINAACWYYLDGEGAKQGPFSFKDMYAWYKGGYFAKDLQIRTIWDNAFRALATFAEFMNTPPSVVEKIEKALEESIASTDPDASDPSLTDIPKPVYQDYTVVGTFNAVTGTFLPQDMPGVVSAKAIPLDKDQRMMSYYFDYERYASQMNSSNEDKKKKQKQVKGSKKFWKARKDEKRRKKLIAEYMKD